MSSSVNLETMRRYLLKDKFAHMLGIELDDVKEGWAKTSLRIRPDHLNGLGTVHGGVMFTLADIAFIAAASSRGSVTVSINNTIAYAKPPKGDIIYAECQEITSTNKLGTYNVNITDATGETIAVFQGTVFKKSLKVEHYESV